MAKELGINEKRLITNDTTIAENALIECLVHIKWDLLDDLDASINFKIVKHQDVNYLTNNASMI